MKKFISTLLLLAVMILAACSSGDDASDKEKVIEAFENTLEATSYNSTSDVQLNLEGNFNDPMVDPYIQMFNDMEISFDGIYDKDAGKQEGTFHFTGSMAPMTINLNIPFLQDMESEKVYVRTDSLVENFGMMFGMTDELSGKLLEIDLAELEQQAGTTTEQMDPEELAQKAQQVVVDVLNEKSDDDFSEEDGVYTVQLTREDFVSLLEKSGDEFDETISEEELNQIQSDLDEMAEQMEVHQFEVQVTLDGDYIENQTFVADVEVTEGEETFRFGVTLDSTYNSINEDVEFSIDPESEEIITLDELNAMMYGF